MHIGLLVLATDALQRVADTQGDRHLVDPPRGTLDEVLLVATREIATALAHLRGALTALQPTINVTARPCACAACDTTGIEVDAAIHALRQPLPPPTRATP